MNIDNKTKLFNILMSQDIIKSINEDMDELLEIIPEINEMIDYDQKNPQHIYDVWEHTKMALSFSDANFDIRLTLLLHDIGKKRSCVEVKGIRHFPNHPIYSAEMANIILNRIGYQEDYIEKICYLIKYHDTPIIKNDINNNYDLTRIRFQVQRCDALAHNPAMLEKRIEYLDKIEKQILYKKI